MKKSLFITVSICFALVLGTASKIHAQSVAGVTGVAGFETGLQLLAAGIGTPVNPSPSSTGSGVTVDWGDGSSDMGLIQTRNSGVSYDVFGTHLYAQPQTYVIHIKYSYQPCDPGPLGFCTNPTVPVDLPTTAKITAPGKFVILSIGDSIASGEGNPNEPINVGTNYPGWSFWDDGYSSYEGYPFPSDVANEWGDPTFPCHRSSYAGPALAANTLVANNPGSGITFIHFACSGATIEPDDTPASAPQSGISSVGWVQDAVGQLKVARARLAKFGVGVDILLISAGSNSMYGPNSFGNGFGGLVKYCLKNGGCSTNQALLIDLINTFNALPAEYERLAMEINCQQPPPFLGVNFIRQADGNNGDVYQDPDPGCSDPQKQIPKLVLITEYMDPTHDQNGAFPTSNTIGPAFLKITFPDDFAFFFNDVVLPLNSTVDLFPWYAQQAGLAVPVYPVLGIGGSGFNPTADDFLDFGVGAGDQKWVNDGNDSINLMGEGPAGYPGEQDCSFLNVISLGGCGTEQLNGMLHPNSAALVGFCRPKCGQDDYSDRIYGSTIQFNPPVTTASATAGGNSYAFGTWAHESVAVSLSASNSIQQAGAGPIYYAVDNSACGSSFAQQSNLANVPGCSVYTAPFTISNSGKHKVTFFGSNASGYPIISSASLSSDSLLLPTNAPLVPPLEGILQSVQVWVNKEPPVMTCTATPSVLWPPNNNMLPVRLNVTAVSALFGQTPFSLKSVATSEGNAATDIHGFVVGQPSTAGSLLASRLGNEKTGRVYTFVYQSTDESGLTGTCTATVTVPHDQGKSNP